VRGGGLPDDGLVVLQRGGDALHGPHVASWPSALAAAARTFEPPSLSAAISGLHRTRIVDLAQRLGSDGPHIVAAPQRADERLDGTGVADLAEPPGGNLAHQGVVMPEGGR